MRQLLVTMGVIALIVGIPLNAGATLTLVNGNAQFVVSETYDPGQWVIDGTQHLFQQGFWFGYATGPEDRLGNYLTAQAQPLPNIGVFDYQTPNFYAQIIYTLLGGNAGSGQADVGELILIRNTSASAINLRFFQYSDFDLGGTPSGDRVWFPYPNTARQYDFNAFVLGETVVTPPPNRWEGALYATTITKLDNAVYDDLSNTPAIGGGAVAGDVTWAFQWNEQLNPGDSFIISKDKRISLVPEPGTVLLFGLGLLGAGIVARRRKRS